MLSFLRLAAIVLLASTMSFRQTADDREFVPSAIVATAPANSSQAPVTLGWNDWLVGNVRTSGSSPYTHQVIVDSGYARCVGAQNGSDGGYLAFYHPLTETASWRLTCRIYLSEFSSAHPTPVISTQIYAPPLFNDASGFAGITTDGSGFPTLTPPAGLPVPARYSMQIGRFYSIEVASTPTTSELRIWSEGESRPTTAQATAASLGPIRRIAFLGVDTATFDYRVDDVLIEDIGASPATVILSDQFQN